MTTNSGTQNTQHQTTTQPWAPAIPGLSGILGNLSSYQNLAGINPTEQAAIQQLTQNTGQIPNFGPSVANTAASYLGGDPYNIVNNAYSNLQNQFSGLTNLNNLNPLNTPGFSDALNTLNQDITQQINGEFADAGRSGSGYNTQTLARGLSQGEGQLLANQYNQNVQNLINAGSQMFGAGVNTNNTLSGNVGTGANLASNVPAFATQGPAAQLQAGATPFNLLTGNQGALAGVTVPIAGLGGQEQGTSNTQVSQTPSLLSSLFGGFHTLFPYGFQGGGR